MFIITKDSSLKTILEALADRDAVRFSNPGGHNLPPLARFGLTELLNSVWALAHLAHPLAASLHRHYISTK